MSAGERGFRVYGCRRGDGDGGGLFFVRLLGWRETRGGGWRVVADRKGWMAYIMNFSKKMTLPLPQTFRCPPDCNGRWLQPLEEGNSRSSTR